MTPSVAPNRPRWRMHAPMLAFLLALAILILAAARPQKTVAVPVERASIMLITDVSGSMQATDVRPTRLVAARTAAKRFVAKVPKTVNVGVMALSSKPRVLAVADARPRRHQPGARPAHRARRHRHRRGDQGGDQHPQARSRASTASARRRPSSCSPTAPRPARSTRSAPRRRRASCASPSTPSPSARRRARSPCRVPAAQGGTETRRVPPDPQSLAEVAKASGGRTYTAADASKLSDVYKSLGSLLGTKNEKRQITAGFAGGALVLLLLGAAMSLRWFGRLI